MSTEVKDLKKKFLKRSGYKEQHSMIELESILSGCPDEMARRKEYSAKYDCSPYRKTSGPSL